MIDRGPYWWERITRNEQRKLVYLESDSVESLGRALERADGARRAEEVRDLYFRVSALPREYNCRETSLTTGVSVCHPHRGRHRIRRGREGMQAARDRSRRKDTR